MTSSHKRTSGVCKTSVALRADKVKEKTQPLTIISEGMCGEKKKRAAFDEKNTSPAVKHAGGCVMRWCGVAASRTGIDAQVDGKDEL